MNVASAFEILQIHETATLSEANASYRRLLMEYHPDRNGHRVEWSHRMTVRLTEAYSAVTAYLKEMTRYPEEESAGLNEEPDSGYSMSMQMRIASLYDQLLEIIGSYYEQGMSNIHLRQEGVLRQRYRVLVRRMTQLIQNLKESRQWPGSALQHSQSRAIEEFSSAFYENMLIKPGEHEVPVGSDARAHMLLRQGSAALDTAIQRGVLSLEHSNGLICPGARHQAEQNFMLVLSGFPRSNCVAETLIKLYLLRSLSGLCEHLEQGL